MLNLCKKSSSFVCAYKICTRNAYVTRVTSLINITSPIQVNRRWVSVKWWPTIDNPWRETLEFPQSDPASKLPNFTVSKDEFKYVEALKPMDLVPPPPIDVEITPSGWIPPRPSLSASKPYTVSRSRNHMLPVYFVEKARKRREQTHGKRMLTIIKKVNGDLRALASDLEVLLSPQCESGRFTCQVDEATGRIVIDGIFVDEVAGFLLENGF